MRLYLAYKTPKEITHERNLVDSKDAAENFVHTIQGLDDRLGPLLLQLPPDFTVEGMDVLDAFLAELPKGPSYAVEVCHLSWLDSDLYDLLHEHGVALTLVDYPRMPRLEEANAGFAYVRWLGNRREFPSGNLGPKKTGPRICAGGPVWWTAFSKRARPYSTTPTTIIRITRPRQWSSSWR